jgi:hypothetical protein
MDYRIICNVQEPFSVPHSHAHIVRIGTGSQPSQYNRQWTIAEVYSAMDLGHTFHTIGARSGIRAEVAPYQCSHCRRPPLRSQGDITEDNNLDNLPRCG